MKILYLGDIMGPMGIEAVRRFLPDIIKEHSVDLVIAQAENVSSGKGLTVEDYQTLKQLGIHGFSGGNWSLHLKETIQLLENPSEPVVRPANYPVGTPGQKYKYIETSKGRVLLVSLLGSIVGKDSGAKLDNPLKVIDEILESQSGVEKASTVVNIHGDYSSEKIVMGHYLDGRVSMVIGDHWHVPTADAQLLPKSSAHITDVGMCGSMDSSLGIEFASVIPRWRDGIKTKNILATKGRLQLNALLAEIDDKTGLATSVLQIQRQTLH